MHKFLVLTLLSFLFTSNLEAQKFLKTFNKGLACAGQKDYENALKNFQKVLKKDQNFAPAYYQIGLVYHDLDSFATALSYYQKSLELDPQQNSLLLNIGNCYFALDQEERAKSYYLKGFALEPEDWMYAGNLGRVYTFLENTDSAIYFLNLAQKLNPTDSYLDLLLASNYTDLADQSKILFHLDKFHQKNPENLHSLRMRGYAKYLDKQYSSAYFDLEKSLKWSEEKDTIDYYAHFYMGMVNLKMNQYSEAIIQLDNGEKIKETDELYYYRAKAKQYVTDFQGAISDFKKVIAFHHDDLALYSDLCISYAGAQDLEGGLQFFKEQIRQNPSHALNFYASALIQSELDSAEIAFNNINRAISLDSSNVALYCLRALLRFELGDNNFVDRPDFMDIEEEDEDEYYDKLQQEVLKDYDLAIQFGSDKIYALERRSNYFYEEGEIDLALKDLKEMEKLDSNLTVYHFLLKGRILMDNKDFIGSIASFNKALEIDDSDGEIHLELAKVYYRTKENDKFCYHVKKAVALGIDTVLILKCQ